MRGLTCLHHGLQWQPSPKPGPKPRRKRAEAADTIDAPMLEPSASPAPSTPRAMVQEALTRQRESHDRFGRALATTDGQPPKSGGTDSF